MDKHKKDELNALAYKIEGLAKWKQAIIYIIVLAVVICILFCGTKLLQGWKLVTKPIYVICETCGNSIRVDRIEDNWLYIRSCGCED